MVSFVVRPATNGFIPRRFIPLPIIEAPNGHEQMSEVGKRITTAECRLVGQEYLLIAGPVVGDSSGRQRLLMIQRP